MLRLRRPLAAAALVAPAAAVLLMGASQKSPTPRPPPGAGEIAAHVGPAARLEPIGLETSAWRLVWTDLDADGREDLLYASYSGRVTRQDLAGGELGVARWRHELGGFPHGLAARDLDGDGKQEVLAVSSAGPLDVLDAKGALRWRHANPAGHPILAFAAGRLLSKDQVHVAVAQGDQETRGAAREIAFLDAAGRTARVLRYQDRGDPTPLRALAAGDVDGDGLDELLVVHRGRRFVLLDPRTGHPRWAKDQGSHFPTEGRLVDLDGDGLAEALVAGHQEVHLVRPDGSGWSEPAAPGGPGRGHRVAQLAPFDLDGDGKLEIAVLHGAMLTVRDRDGQVRYADTSWDSFFDAIAPPPERGGRTLLLGSVTGADRNLYRITFGAEGKDQIGDFMQPPGFRALLDANLHRIRDQVLAAPADPDTPRRTVWVEVTGGSPDRVEQIQPFAKRLAQMRAAYPYENVRFFAYVAHREGSPPGMPVARLLEMAKAYEELGIDHVLAVGHGFDVRMRPETVRAWLERAPKTCIGISISELGVGRGLLATEHPTPGWPDPASAMQFPPYLAFFGKLLDLAAEKGKPVLPMMKSNWWVYVPAAATTRKALFSPERRRALIPWDEPSNQWAPENNLPARVGLWRAGLVPEWGFKIIDDQLQVNRDFFYTPVDAHMTLRHSVAYAAAGATRLGIGKVDYLMRDQRGRFGLRVGAVPHTPYGLLTRDTLIHLLGKGLLQIPARDEIVGLSPIVWRFAEPSPTFLRQSDPALRPRQPQPRPEPGLFTGVPWPLAPTPPEYANRYLLGVERFGHAFVPRTPYGLPAIVPAWAPATADGFGARSFTTDGVALLEDGKRLGAAEARPRVLAAFEAAAQTLPVRASDCYWMATRRKDGTLRVTLVDPDLLEPRDRQVELVAHAPIGSLRDVLSGQPLPFTGSRARIELPAGAFRIVDVRIGAAQAASDAPRAENGGND
jgi:hypothetical protein